jgi:hypothetical protein
MTNPTVVVIQIQEEDKRERGLETTSEKENVCVVVWFVFAVVFCLAGVHCCSII